MIMVELTAKELHAIAAEIAHEARQHRARFRFAERLAELGSVLAEEESMRARVADLKREAESIAVTVAAGDAAQTRLDNLQSEVAANEATMMKAARTTAEQVVRDAWDQAEKIELDAKRRADEAARFAEEDLGRRRNDAAALDRSIAERELRLAKINSQIEKLRAKINDE
jgi:hypothetical protein